ncbi:MAG: radical SAM protein, partial [SAR324 cluster bacterium]|nr:radical SAM protein [SAR324 cluster bacterium]
KKPISDFETADSILKGLVNETKGPVYDGDQLIYAPIIIGGHYNNYNFKESWERGGEYIVRGKGINLFRDILLGLYRPGIYHDPMPYANIPRMDRENFYRDTFAFSDETKKYALSQIKSVLTALGCNYSCTYCYISSLIDNLKEAYQDKNLKPPSIIQDRLIEVVLEEGLDILRLDQIYDVKTTAVFDQADISLNNMDWWEELHDQWVEKVRIPFYIQARPAMLAGQRGKERIEIIAKSRLVAGISMAIESGDPKIRKLLLDRHEGNEIILDAINNVKEYRIPLRTQSIVGLPVLRPSRIINPAQSTLSLIDKTGKEYYYEDPIQESLKCLELVCASNFGKEDYYWNALYSPFPGTPLGDYTVAAGFADEDTDARAYLFMSDSGLRCFTGITLKRQIAFSLTSNFFSHFQNGKDLMVLFLYGNNNFALTDFIDFIYAKAEMFKPHNRSTRFGIIPNIDRNILLKFFDHAYPVAEDEPFRIINTKLMDYYMTLLDGLILAAKVAVRYDQLKRNEKEFTLSDLYRVERVHYYDNSYNMAYVPDAYQEFLNSLIHDSRLPSNSLLSSSYKKLAN